ncbi:DNA polymerase III subunit delta' [Ferrimonas sp. SCSIO 43195]|uniref:DNA polymerase III subunit delta' n=1 Tax=Ferrimonas sp. SCSIO 43195 TaxID=2822844 RepID=UPI0020756428|nr:DNA polymerase III subunit delta' [Ferrimonas sp. SCSIO 43195]USD39558.1 DNA polymerase III subunit delta' [Ferrimonas sp. SCSIO 43195]
MNTLPQSLAAMPWLEPSWQLWQQARAGHRLSHGWLLCGGEGIGKHRLALALAHSLLCEQGKDCGLCRGCQLLAAGNHPDFIELKPDGKVIKVEQIRALLQELSHTAHQGGARVVVVHQADAMNGASANALLKTLEEPAPGVHILLVSDHVNRLLPTIASRCQRLLVATPTLSQSQAYLGQPSLPTEKLCRYLKLLGGPLALHQAMEQQRLERIDAWQLAWQRSLADGLLDDTLIKLDADDAALALKLLYIELVADQKSYINQVYSRLPLARAVADAYQTFQLQSGLNHVAVFQHLLSHASP